MLESFSFRVSAECHGCRISIPLNGVIGSARCYHCGETNDFDGAFWVKALDSSCFAKAMELAPGQTREITQLEHGLHVEYGRASPRCERCRGAEVDLAQLETYASQGSCTCTACGAGIPVRRADPLCLRLNSGARYLLNEQAPGAAGEALQARTKPVVFQCMSCGGALQVDGSKRLVSCQFCNNDNYLPDGLWQILNPVPKPVPFFFVCEYENVAERAARASRETGDALRVLAQDAAPEVRRAVAANPATPPTVLEKLAFDPSRQVLEGLAMNPNLPSEIVDEMAQSNDPEFQMLAARHPRLNPAHLPRLARAEYPATRQVASERVNDLRARGVVIDESAVTAPVKGFFARLFGG